MCLEALAIANARKGWHWYQRNTNQVYHSTEPKSHKNDQTGKVSPIQTYLYNRSKWQWKPNPTIVISKFCSPSRTIIACHWRDIRQKSIFTMFENVYIFCHILKMGSPLPFGWRLAWVVPLKTTHPKIIGMLASF